MRALVQVQARALTVHVPEDILGRHVMILFAKGLKGEHHGDEKHPLRGAVLTRCHPARMKIVRTLPPCLRKANGRTEREPKEIIGARTSVR